MGSYDSHIYRTTPQYWYSIYLLMEHSDNVSLIHYGAWNHLRRLEATAWQALIHSPTQTT